MAVSNEEVSSKYTEKKIIVLSIITLLILAACTGGYYFFTKTASVSQSDVVAEVGGEKVYLADYQARFKAATLGFSAKQTVDASKYAKEGIVHDLAEEKMLDKELANRNLTVTDADLVAAAKEKFSNYDKQDKAHQTNDKVLATTKAKENVLGVAVVTYRQGFALYCRFDRANQDDYKGKDVEAAALRAKQKAYAKDYCDKTKTRLENKTSNFPTELASLGADSVIGTPSWKPWNVLLGNPFWKNDFSQKIFIPSTDIYDQIAALKPTQDNTYNMLTVKDTGQFGTKGQERMYAIVYLKDKGKDGETTDFNNWLQNKWSEYKVKTYPERIK